MKNQEQICREEWFKNHQANIVVSHPGCTIIGWRNPESWNYGCRYIIHRNWLTVVGDIGEAVYGWGQDIDLDFLSKCDAGYFLSKCQASETGTRFTLWNSKTAAEAVHRMLSDGVDGLDIRNALQDIDHNTPREEFDDAVRKAYYGGLDSESVSYLIDCGNQPHPRAIGHWVGLKMVAEQLREMEVIVPQ